MSMANLRKNLAANVRHIRGEQTQQMFARKAGIHQATINRIEQGTQNITIDTIQKLCDGLKCTAGELLDTKTGK